MSDQQFPQGIFFNPPHANAPDFVKGQVAINVKAAVPWLQQNATDSGYVNLDLKESKNGKWYLAPNTWEQDSNKGRAAPRTAPIGDDRPPEAPFDDTIPF